MMEQIIYDRRAIAWTAKGSQRISYTVYLDTTRLEALAQQAAQNKNGRACLGALCVKITKREGQS
jgi:hypothetical protein